FWSGSTASVTPMAARPLPGAWQSPTGPWAWTEARSRCSTAREATALTRPAPPWSAWCCRSPHHRAELHSDPGTAGRQTPRIRASTGRSITPGLLRPGDVRHPTEPSPVTPHRTAHGEQLLPLGWHRSVSLDREKAGDLRVSQQTQDSDSPEFGPNQWLVDALREQWREDPSSV